jgi:hypothetical protein
MKKKYIVKLTEEERASLKKLISSGKSSAQKLMRAHILLSADVSEGSVCSDKDIAKSLKTSPSNVERTRIRFVEESLEIALNGIERKLKEPVKIDGKVQAHIAMLACTTPPAGRGSWTLQLLANGVIAAKVVDYICRESVRIVLKKTNLSLGRKNNGVFHQESQAQIL